MEILIPDRYVSSVNERLNLYNRINDLEKEEQKRIEQELEDQRREEEAYWRLVEQRRLEQGEDTPDVPVNTEVADDGTTGGIDDLIKTLPTGLGDFEGIDMTGGSAGETAGGTDMDDFGDFEGIDIDKQIKVYKILVTFLN